MTGPEHYREAERLLGSDPLDEGHVAVAQVHATLALAAATAESGDCVHGWAAAVTKPEPWEVA